MKKLLFIAVSLLSVLFLLISCGGRFTPNSYSVSSRSNFNTMNWDFTLASEYTYLTDRVTFSDGLAQIKSIALNYSDSASYLPGTYSEMIHAAGLLKLKPNSQTQLSLDWTPHFSNLTGYWKMDNNWADSSSNTNNGVANGATFESNIVRVGIRSGNFDGDDTVDIADNSSLDTDLKDSFTMMFWYNPSSSDKGSEVKLITKGCDNGTNLVDSSYMFTKTVADKVEFFLTKDGSTAETVLSNQSVNFDSWNHIAVTFDGTGLRIYLNAIEEANTAVTGSMFDSDSKLMIGAKIGSATCDSDDQFSQGQFDELALFSKPHLAADIMLIYQRQSAKYSGTYTSEVIDTGGVGYNWVDLKWVTTLPFYKELTGDVNASGTPNSESSGQYADLTGTNGLPSDNNHMNNLIVYYRLNGSSDYNGVANEVKDFSGSGNHGQAVGGAISPTTGRFYQGREFLGDGKTINTPSLTSTFLQDKSVSFWLRANPVQADVGSTRNIIYSEGDGSRKLQLFINNQTHPTSSSIGKLVLRKTDGTNNTDLWSSVKINDGKFHHIVIRYKADNLSLFVDGLFVAGPILDSTLGAYSGTPQLTFSDATDSFSGAIDEFAYWTRGLHANEVFQLYRRGANRVKFLVKSCIDISCNCDSYSSAPAGSATDCDGDGITNTNDSNDLFSAKWKGPTNNSEVLFTELVNNDSILTNGQADGNVSLIAPKLTYADFASSGLALTNNQYFKFRVFMQSDDESSSCAGGACSPEISSIVLGPKLKHGAEVVISNNNTFTYEAGTIFNSVSIFEITDANCSYGYQLSPDNGTTYYYHDSNSWIPITGANEKSLKADVEGHINQFSDQFKSGVLKFKVYMQSLDQQTDCAIDSIMLNF